MLAENDNLLIVKILKAFLRHTDIMLYVEYLFASTFERANNFSSIPKTKRRYLSQSYQEDGIIKKFPASADKEDYLSVSEVIMFCQEILNKIEGSLAIMPLSVRCLLKAIENYAAETVLFIKSVDSRTRN